MEYGPFSVLRLCNTCQHPSPDYSFLQALYALMGCVCHCGGLPVLVAVTMDCVLHGEA